MKKKSILTLVVASFSFGCAGPQREDGSSGAAVSVKGSPTIPPDRFPAMSAVREPKEWRERGEALAIRYKEGMDRAEALFAAGKLPEAASAAEKAGLIYPRPDGRTDAMVAYLLGQIYMRQGHYAKALGVMAPNVQRDIARQRWDLALCYLKVGDLAHARALYDPDALFARTDSILPGRRWTPDVRSARALEGALLWAKGLALSDVARREEAVDCYAQASRLLPKNPVLALNLAMEARNAKRFRASADAFKVVQSLGGAKVRELTRHEAEAMESAAKEAPFEAPPSAADRRR